MEESVTKENETKIGDYFGRWKEILQLTPISYIKVADFNYEQLPTTSF